MRPDEYYPLTFTFAQVSPRSNHHATHHRLLFRLLDGTEHHQVTVLHNHSQVVCRYKVDWLTLLSNHHSTTLVQWLDDTVDLLSDWN
jgi:hypothetical protein